MGEFIFHELEPSGDSIQDEYILELDKKGYYLPSIKGIIIKKGEENLLEYTIDLTKLLELRGKVTINGEPATDGELVLNSQSLKNFGEKIFINCFIDKNGYYSFKGIHPGVYSLSIACFDSYEKILEETRLIEIEEGKSKILDMHFEVEK